MTSWTTVTVCDRRRRVADLQPDGVPRRGPFRVGAGGEPGDELGRRSSRRWRLRLASTRAMPRSTAAISSGRRSAAAMMRCTEPTALARSTLWIGVELGGDLAELLGAHELDDRWRARRDAGRPRSSERRGQRPLERLHPLVGTGALVDLAGEHDGRRRRPADHRGERTLDGEHLHVVVERRREDDERPAVVARDDAQHERAVEVDEGPADLGAVLQLQAAQRLRRAVEARTGWRASRRAACRWPR